MRGKRILKLITATYLGVCSSFSAEFHENEVEGADSVSNSSFSAVVYEDAIRFASFISKGAGDSTKAIQRITDIVLSSEISDNPVISNIAKIYWLYTVRRVMFRPCEQVENCINAGMSFLIGQDEFFNLYLGLNLWLSQTENFDGGAFIDNPDENALYIAYEAFELLKSNCLETVPINGKEISVQGVIKLIKQIIT